MKRLFKLIKGLAGAKGSGVYASEMKHLTEMTTHQAQRENEIHNDFLSMVGESESDHLQRMDHHGSQFWARSYEDESPGGVVQDEPISKHQYGTFQDQQSVQAHQLRPVSISCMIPTRERPRLDRLEGIASEQDWLDHIRIAELALEQQDFSEAEDNFRLALNAAKAWSPGDLRLIRTLTGLANSLTLQAKT